MTSFHDSKRGCVVGAMCRWAPAALMIALAGCATTAGTRFTGVAPPTPDQGDVYVYRAPAAFAADQPFTVMVDDQPVAQLASGTYLWLRMRPGGHLVAVVPGRATRVADAGVQVAAGSATYLQYDFATGSLANPNMIGAQLRERSAIDAADAWSDLTAADANRTGSTATAVAPIASGSPIPVDDIEAVPGLDASGRAGYREWLRRSPPRAFVVAGDGTWNSAWGQRGGSEADPIDPSERAIRSCQRAGQSGCRLYAVDHRVVWSDAR